MNSTVKKLKLLGYDFAPVVSLRNRETLAALTPEEWKDLKPTDPLVQDMIRAYSLFMAEDTYRLTQKHHGRAPIHDGILRSAEQDPANHELFTVLRCNCPDFGPAAGPSETWEAGEGSWPSCDHDTANTVRVFHDYSGVKRNMLSTTKRAISRAREAFQDCGLLIIDTSDERDAQTVFHVRELGGGTAGLANVISNHRCGSRGYFFDLDDDLTNEDVIASVYAHEQIHNCGYGHKSGDRIQSPSVTGKPFRKTFRDISIWPTLERWFGGDPVNTDPEPPPTDPPTPPGPGDAVLRLRLEDPLTGKKYVFKERPDLG